MLADEHGFLDLGQGGVRQAGFALADVDGTIGQAGQHGQTVEEGLGLFLDDQLRTGGQRVGVHGGDEDGARGGTHGRYLAERAGTQRGPLA